MNLSLFFAALLLFIVAAFQLVAATAPGSVTVNGVSGGIPGVTLAAGDPYLGRVGDINYIIGASQNWITGNTTVCTFEANFNGTCVEDVLELRGINNYVDEVIPASTTEAFLVTVRNSDTLTATSYRWSATSSLEWSLSRGNITGAAGTTQITMPSGNFDFQVRATADGTNEFIDAGVTKSGTRKNFGTMILPVPAANVKPNTAYAQDLFFPVYAFDAPFIGGISLGRPFTFPWTGTDPTTLITNPCGFSSTKFRGINAKIYGSKGISYEYIVYGNDATSGDFVLCSLASNSTLNQLWSLTVPGGITPVYGDLSVKVIQTQHNDGLVPITVNYLYISGWTGQNDQQNILFAFDLSAHTLAWQKTRLMLEQTNMPVLINAEYNHIAVTIQGVMQGIDPVSPNTPIWSCATQKIGCSNTPAVLATRTANPLARLSCTDANSVSTVIAFDINTPNANQCQLQWTDSLPYPIAVKIQSMPSISTYNVYPFEPFSTFLDEQANLWTFTFRSAAEPAPTLPPTPAPTVPPTFPSGTFPGPKSQLYTPAPFNFDSIDLQDTAVIANFNADGPIMAAVAYVQNRQEGDIVVAAKDPETADFYMRNPEFKTKASKIKTTLKNEFNIDTMQDEKVEESNHNNNKATTAPLSNYAKVLYFQAIPIGGLESYNFGMIQTSASFTLAGPIVVSSGTSQFVTASYEILGDGWGYMLYTDGNTANPGALYDKFGRYGAIGALATDGAGVMVYSVGYVNNAEYIIAKQQKGDGSATTIPWSKTFKPPTTGYKPFSIFSSHIGDILYANAAIKSMIYQWYSFSYLNQLHFVSGATGGSHSFVNFTNPCGFVPSNSSIMVYYPMDLFWVRDSSVNVVVSIIDTWDQYGDYSYGFCAIDISTPTPTVDHGIPIQNVSLVGSLQAIGTANVYAVDILNSQYRGELVVLSTTSSRELWRTDRDNAYGDVIIGIPGSSVFVTNMDTQANSPYDTNMKLSVVDSQTGTIYGQCDYAFEEFALVPGADSNTIGIVGSIFGDNGEWERFVRYIQFVQTGTNQYTCNVVWQTDLGAVVDGISSVSISVNNVNYVSIVTVDGKVYSLSLAPGAIPTPAPPLPAGDVPDYAIQTNLSSYWQTPVARQASFSPILFGDFANVGNPAFATVDAGYTGTPQEEEGAHHKEGDTPAKRYTALVGFDAAAMLKPSQYPVESHFLLMEFTTTSFPLSLFNNYGFSGTQPPPKAAVAWTAYGSDPFLYVMSYPGERYRWQFPRFGGTTNLASDGNGRLFWSVGAYQGAEGFYAAQLSADGTQLLPLWNVSVYPREAKIYNLTSGIGDAEWIYTHDHPTGYVAFSFEHTLYIRDAATGYAVGAVQDPCGYTPPNDADNENFPYPMLPVLMELENHSTRIITLVNAGPGVDSGNWGICFLAPDGSYAAWKADMPPAIDHFIKVMPIFFSTYILISAVSAMRGGGVLIGIDATTGNQWMVQRVNAIGTLPAPIAFSNTQDTYFVANMDSIAPDEPKSYYLSVAKFKNGKVVAQCPFACAINPIRTFVDNGDGTFSHYFVCTLVDHPTVLRAVQFVPNSNTNNIFDCVTYWDYQLPLPANGVFLVDHTYISVSLINGGVATVSMISHNGANGRNVPSAPAPSGGMSGGAVAALVICMLVLVAVIAFVVYYTKFRTARRSAISEAQSGLEYGSGSSAGIQGGGGYGATTTAGEV